MKSIIFKAPQVKAALNGATQIRVPIKPQPPEWATNAYFDGITWLWTEGTPATFDFRRWPRARPYLISPYQPGDLVYVKETFLQRSVGEVMPHGEYEERWDGGAVEYVADGAQEREVSHNCWLQKRPSVHMPRWASRITLKITDVQVQRVQDISEADCEIELGVEPFSLGNDAYPRFKAYWNATHPKPEDKWGKNPRVWVITYEKETG